MITTLFFISIGLVGLLIGSELSIHHGEKIAYKLRFKPEMVGLTFLAIGTSLPELVTNIFAGIETKAGNDASGLAVGNIIGSCLSQITLILGIVALFSRFTVDKKIITKNGVWVVVAMVAATVTSLDGIITRIDGLLLVGIFITYLIHTIHSEKMSKEEQEIEEVKEQKKINVVISILLIITGLLLLIGGAHLIVENGVSLAKICGINEIIIGLFIGVGTSLPELAVAYSAVRNKKNNISATNILGSNIADPLLALGAGAIVANVIVERSVLLFDIPFWIVGTLVALLLFRSYSDVNKSEGLVYILLYCLYIFLRLVFIS